MRKRMDMASKGGGREVRGQAGCECEEAHRRRQRWILAHSRGLEDCLDPRYADRLPV